MPSLRHAARPGDFICAKGARCAGCDNGRTQAWKWWLNNTTVTLGMQNVTDEDPPFVAGSFENGYDESLATIKGRFWYVGLKKRF